MVFKIWAQDPRDPNVISRVGWRLGVSYDPRATRSNRRRSTPAHASDSPVPSTPNWSSCATRFVSYAGPTTSCRRRPVASGGARPPAERVVAVIDAHRDNETGGRRSRGRADLRQTPGRSLRLLRAQEPPNPPRGRCSTRSWEPTRKDLDEELLRLWATQADQRRPVLLLAGGGGAFD